MSATVKIPVSFRRHGARRLIVAPDDAINPSLSQGGTPDPILVGALVRAHRWQQMIEQNMIGNIERLAEQEGLTSTFVSRILRLNYLAPDIKRAILIGTQPKTLRLSSLMSGMPNEWEDQHRSLLRL